MPLIVLHPAGVRDSARLALRRLRRTAGLTQVALARRLHVHWKTVSFRERGLGRGPVDIESFVRTCDALGHDVALIPRAIERTAPGSRMTGTGWPA